MRSWSLSSHNIDPPLCAGRALQGVDSSSIGFSDQVVDEHLQQNVRASAQHGAASPGGTVKLHRKATARSMQLGGEEEGMQASDGDIDSQEARALALGVDDTGAALSLGGSGGSPEGTEGTTEQSDAAEGVESESSGESVTKDKPEDRGQELQVSCH